MKPTIPAILIDTREQEAFTFAGRETRRGTLHAGDYSLLGLESIVAVERKSKADYWGCLGKGRKRFEACLERLSAVTYPLVVIECSLEDLDEPMAYAVGGGGADFSRIPPKVAQHTLLSWMQRYRVPILPCGTRRLAARTTLSHLEMAWRNLSLQRPSGLPLNFADKVNCAK